MPKAGPSPVLRLGRPLARFRVAGPPGARPPPLTHRRPAPAGWAGVGQKLWKGAPQSAIARCPGAAQKESPADAQSGAYGGRAQEGLGALDCTLTPTLKRVSVALVPVC
jgi:hypothetical protein